MGAEESTGGLDAVAARMVRQVTMVQPEEPDHLLGWSYGGLVAHALATRLRADGRKVAVLALLDAYPLHEGPEPAGHCDRQREFLTELGVAELLGPERTRTMAAELRYTARLAHAHKPGVFDGDLVLVASRSAAAAHHPGAEWGPYVIGRTVVHEVDCPPARMPHRGPMRTVGPIPAELLSHAAGPDRP
ncbi:thioesterase domain-containing protein [Streptomyces sp. NPDC048481]|uniref:thioesterase domain-containing protein n=1 Tax=Streptomyces sp. NPDC048481 TaxID=3365557 RepID=UPI003720B0E3